MEFQTLKNDFRSNIYETSKSKKQGSAVLSVREEQIEVYDLDQLKDWFCEKYRNDQKLCSCDAYYQDTNNFLVMEFKNTHHLRIKEYISEIIVKIIDTHFLLAETFFSNRKISKISSNVNMLLVYNDNLEYGTGVRRIGAALNSIEPISGDTSRNSKEKDIYNNDDEFQRDVDLIKTKFEGDFYKSIEFVDKKDFMLDYIEPKYFSSLN